MRRFFLFVCVVPALFLGCEDGPAQTYSPAPANAANIWNNGNSPAAVDEAGTSFGATYGGTSKTEICSGGELQSQWARMVEQPIVPPYHVAGMDLSGINYQFLTVEQAENGINGALMPVQGAMNPPTRLCQGADLGSGPDGGDVGGSLVTGWGNNQEITMEWAVPTHKAYVVNINPGYVGAIDWSFTTNAGACPLDPTYMVDGNKHQYHWQLGKPLTKDGATFTLDWNGYNTPPDRFNCESDELYRGLTQAFVPDLYDNLPPGDLCVDTGRCPVFPTGNDGVHPIIGFRTISMYWNMGPPSQPQPSGTTLFSAYFYNIKYAPYSAAVINLKMDAVGPTGSLNPIGNQTPAVDCELRLGGTFGDLANNCINVNTDATVNTTSMAKVLGDLTHDDQNFTFAIVGVNQNYRPPQLDIGGSRQFDIIHDNETPQPDAIAVDFTLDVRANGGILNDRIVTSTPGVLGTDHHGAGAVWRDMGRSVQRDLASKYAAQHGTVPRALHDPACLFPMSCQGGPSCGARDYGACSVCTTDALNNCVGAPGCLQVAGQPTGTCSTCSADAANKCVGDPNCKQVAGQPAGTCAIDPTLACSWYYNWAPGQGPNTWHAAAGCTGFEGWVDEAYPNVKASDGTPVNPADATKIDPSDTAWDIAFTFGDLSNNGLRPGGPYAFFCLDPGIYNFCGAPSLFGQSAPLLDASNAMVLQILGNGDPNSLPPGVGDYRYFFQAFTTAYARYLESGAALHTGQNASPPDPVPYFNDYLLNTDDLFFDSFGGNANRSEFVQYDYADMTHDPTDLNISMLLIGSNLQEVHYYRRLDREERALFEAMGNADAKVAGQASWGLLHDATNKIVKDEWGQPRKNASMFISNIAGSPAIAAGPWSAPSDASGNPIPVGTPNAYDPCFPTTPPAMVMKTAWYCATHVDPDCPVGAPTDDSGAPLVRTSGEPILAGYCGIWNPTALALGTSNLQLVNDDITPQQQELEEEAEVVIPNYANPYDPTSAMTPIKVLVPWLPNQNGVGFPVATTGQQDIFVQTAELDFSGQVVVPVMDYLPVQVTPTTADGGAGTPYTGAQVLAYESQDFLGDAFLCYDAVSGGERRGTGRPGDILAAHMYTSAQEILTWLATHPTAQDNCTIIVRYSPYNNFPDYISSLTNGVRVGIDLGAGLGRVTDLTVFTPGVGAPAAP